MADESMDWNDDLPNTDGFYKGIHTYMKSHSEVPVDGKFGCAAVENL